jgi:hypothetical protein
MGKKISSRLLHIDATTPSRVIQPRSPSSDEPMSQIRLGHEIGSVRPAPRRMVRAKTREVGEARDDDPIVSALSKTRMLSVDPSPLTHVEDVVRGSVGKRTDNR